MMRRADIYFYGRKAGRLTEDENGYAFAYDADYLRDTGATAISPTLPLTDVPVSGHTLPAFFDGLIPEGWLLDVAEKNWKLNRNDRMGLLLSCCKECIGAVSVREVPEEARP